MNKLYYEEFIGEHNASKSTEIFKEDLKQSETKSEILLTAYSFVLLSKTGLLNKFIKKQILNEKNNDITESDFIFNKKIVGGCSDELHNLIVKNNIFQLDSKIRNRNQIRKFNTEFDVVIFLKTVKKKITVIIESKYLSDISIGTTNDQSLNQLARNLDQVYQLIKRNEDVYFVLLTPRIFKEDKRGKFSRLYGYKFLEYSSDISAITRDLAYLTKHELLMKIQEALKWITFEDIIEFIENNSEKKLNGNLEKVNIWIKNRLNL